MDILSNLLINEANIPYHTVIMLLSFPIISTIIALVRYFLGVKSFGLYPHLMIIYTLYTFSIITNTNSVDFFRGLKIELLFLLAAIISISLSKKFFDRVNFHVIPRKNLLLTIGIASVILVLFLANLSDKKGVLEVPFIAIFGILVVAEKYLNFSMKKGTLNAIKYMVYTIVSCVAITFIITAPIFQNILLSNTWIIIVAIFANILIGSYGGIRLSEILRFKNIKSN